MKTILALGSAGGLLLLHGGPSVSSSFCWWQAGQPDLAMALFKEAEGRVVQWNPVVSC